MEESVKDKLVIGLESLKVAYEEGSNRFLTEAHFKEVGFGSSNVGLKYDLETMVKLDNEQKHALFVARLDGEVVGYLAFIIVQYNYLDAKTAQAYALYVKPSKRGLSIGKSLISHAESVLYHTFNCNFVQLTSNTNKDIGGFIEKMGYFPTDIIYTKGFTTVKENLTVQKEAK